MALENRIGFEVTAFHLALLKRIRFQEGERVPTVSSKRPYGNSDVIGDLQEIYSGAMGYEVLRLRDEGSIVIQGDRVISRGDGTGQPDSDFEAMLWRAHEQMSTVLQILVDNLGIEEGRYSVRAYGGRWQRLED